jgi:hypothetical protein
MAKRILQEKQNRRDGPITAAYAKDGEISRVEETAN